MPLPSVNRVTLLGKLHHNGVAISYLPSGVMKASFTLIVAELSKDGKVYETFVPCEIFGKGADDAGAIQPETLCYFEGKLRRRKIPETDRYEMAVGGFELIPCAQTTATDQDTLL